MPGYHLMEHELPASLRQNSSERPFESLGFLDFLRELNAEEPAIAKYSMITLLGLEEVLFAAGGEAEALALEIHRQLRTAASYLQNRLVDIYVLFKGRLQRGDDLWVDYRGARLPIGHIFGSPHPQLGPGGQRVFFANFNLTHGG
jgi:hypothetical protein